MGGMLPKPVLATVMERRSGSGGFLVGLAEINGWRRNMEDAHVVHLTPDWGFFGVFDGHGGEKCSRFVANEFEQHLETAGCPTDDTAFRELALGIDDKFLKSGQSSGSTGAMCIVHKPSSPDGKIKLHVGNVGDSRVLLGKRDGTLIDGGGTDGGLTTDHKPSHPSEKERIYRCGGFVSVAMGNVARVNGDLAVSRAFGDASYKKTGGPRPDDRPVTASPEFGHFECDSSDFLVIVCDGISEGSFTNGDVVRFIAEQLRISDDLGDVSRRVCWRAEEANSKDNCTCMIVLFTGASHDEHQKGFTPGPFCKDSNFVNAFEAMAKRADLTLGEAIQIRHEQILAVLQDEQLPREARIILEKELKEIGQPPGDSGHEERRNWFESQVWAQETSMPTGERVSIQARRSSRRSESASADENEMTNSKSCTVS